MSAFEMAGGPGPTGATGETGAAAPSDGWVDDSAATWTRTGNQTFTVTGDRTAVFQKGTRLRWTQTTVKYGVVIGSSHAAGTTTVTIATNTDYVLTAAAISVNSYSYAEGPQGFPISFAYTPTWSSSGTQPALVDGTISGRGSISASGLVTALVILVAGSSSTFGTGTYALSLPVDMLAATRAVGICKIENAGVKEYIGIAISGLAAGNLILRVQQDSTGMVVWGQTTPFTFGSTDEAVITATYWMA